jgi:hypothetical protein
VELWGVIGRFADERMTFEGERYETMTFHMIVTDGEAEIVTAKIAFNREYTEHPEVTLEEALVSERAKAEAACDVINAMLDDEDRRRAEAVYETRKRVQEILGRSVDEPV